VSKNEFDNVTVKDLRAYLATTEDKNEGLLRNITIDGKVLTHAFFRINKLVIRTVGSSQIRMSSKFLKTYLNGLVNDNPAFDNLSIELDDKELMNIDNIALVDEDFDLRGARRHFAERDHTSLLYSEYTLKDIEVALDFADKVIDQMYPDVTPEQSFHVDVILDLLTNAAMQLQAEGIETLPIPTD
jgi:hypothetical protein